jgi:iron complex outermembrane receptor protein
VQGVTVHILNTNLAVASDANGNYIFDKITPGKYTLQFSAVGFSGVNKETLVSTNDVEIPVTLPASINNLDEVVVSAEKKEQLIQELPVSITALSAEKINQFRLWNSRDLTAISPNLYSADPGDKRNSTSIRGISTTSYDPAVATYIDGVNQFTLDTYISPLFDIERIEVLRGPQGTLYGRNAMGGVINIITKQPGNKTDLFAEVSQGNYSLGRYSAGVRTPVIKDKLFFGAAGMYEGWDGYFTNEFNNSPYDKQHSIIGNYFLKLIPTGKFSITLNAKNNNNRNTGPFPLVFGKDEAFMNPYKLNQNALTKIIDNSFNTSLSLNYAGTKFNLSSQTAYLYNYKYYNQPIDADFSPLDGITLNNDFGKEWNNVKVVTEDLKFSSPAGSESPLKWIAGTYLFVQNSPTKADTHFGNDGMLFGAPDNNFSLINSSKAKGKGAAFYGQLTYGITDQLNLTGGLRYDYEHKELAVLGEYKKDGQVFPTLPDTSSSADFNALSPKLSLDYSFTKNHMLYGSYSRGFRAGGLTPISSDPSQPALYAYKPEYSNNIEIGIKNSFLANKIFLNLVAFYTTVTDAQVPTLVLPEGVSITRNTGELSSKGVELEFSAIPVKGLELLYNAGYTDASYKDLKLAQQGSEVDLKGKHPVLTPEYTSMLAAQYNIQFGPAHSITAFIRGELKSLGTQYFDLANTIKQDAYSLMNANLGAEFKNFRLSFWARNIAGEKYIGYAYDFGAVHLGDPSTYGITLRIHTSP